MGFLKKFVALVKGTPDWHEKYNRDVGDLYEAFNNMESEAGRSIIPCRVAYDAANKVHVLTPLNSSQTIPTSGIIPVTFIPDADFHAGDKLRFNGQDCDAAYSNTDLAVADGAFRAGFVTSVVFQFVEAGGGTDRTCLVILHNGEAQYASNAGKAANADNAAKLNGLASEAYIQPQDDMLINSNWQYGYINQKGQIRYNTDGYCLDNWHAYNTDVIINSGSINIKSKAQDSYKHFSQKTEHTLKAGNVYTITMLAKINSAENAFFRPSTKQLSGITGASGLKLTAGSKFELYSYTFIPTEDVESGALDFIAGNGASHNYDIDLAAVKLEPGPRFTGWPVWNYALELAKCQRYALEMVSASNNEHGKVGIGNVFNETTAVIFCPTPVSLRTTPSASFAGNFRLVESGRWEDGIPVTSINANHVTTNGISLYVNTTGGLHVGKCYELVFNSSERNSLLLNANL